MPTIKIKEPDRLFENQLPRVIDNFIQGWYTSVIKIEKMCEDPAFKESFLKIYQKEHSNDFNFREVTNNITLLCKNLEKIASSMNAYTGKKTMFKNPLSKMPKKEKVQISENKNNELEDIKETLSKTRDIIQEQIKDIKLNWQDHMFEKFSNNMDYFLNCINSLDLCCQKTQNQIKSTKR